MSVPKSAYDPAIHHRRSIRLRGHDYAGRGAYFLTICVAGNRPLFGTVVNGRMALNEAGRMAAQCWREIPTHFLHAALDEWIIMPDHVHGIIILRDDPPEGTGEKSFANSDGGTKGGEKSFAPTPDRPHGTSRTIGSIVRGFKIGVTKLMGGDSPWHRNYYDLIVRDPRALDNIRAYIRNNPANWDVLRHGEPRFFAGNRELLNLPQTAFLASRMGDEGERFFASARWPVRPECVISGFLSPMEHAVFKACLSDGIPMVHILARGLPERFSTSVQRAMDAGLLLVTTPFEPLLDRFSAARAAWCNQYALHLAREIVIGRLNSGGLLACLLADLPRDKSIHILWEQETGTD